jgi:hypothetical protein
VVAVGVDRPEEPESADARPERPTACTADNAADSTCPRGLTDPEQRIAAYLDYRDKVINREAAHAWDEAVPQLRATWEKVKIKFNYTKRSVDISQPPDGSWRGVGGRTLDSTQNAEVNHGYARIRDVAEQTIAPALRSIESADPTRRLAGFDHRLKGPDRLKEKIADLLDPPSKLTASDALHAVSDVVRFTYTYPEASYTQGVLKDVERLKSHGFELDKLKNTWSNDQYKGVNAQWEDAASGVRFEVQFHTWASKEAKELSHDAYKRLRGTEAQDDEREELEAFQGMVNAEVPIPPDVSTIEEERNG